MSDDIIAKKIAEAKVALERLCRERLYAPPIQFQRDSRLDSLKVEIREMFDAMDERETNKNKAPHEEGPQ